MEHCTRLLVILFLFTKTDSASILCAFPTPAYSHYAVFKALVYGLLENKHRVTLFSTVEIKHTSENLTVIDLTKYNELWNNGLKKQFRARKKSRFDNYNYLDALKASSDGHLRDSIVQNVLKNYTFDLIITEAAHYFIYEALAKYLKLPVIGVASLDATIYDFENMGVDLHPGIYPDARNLPFVPELTFYERVMSMWHYLEYMFVFVPAVKKELVEVFEKRIGRWPGTSDYEVLFINAHPALLFRRPLPTTIVDITGIHLEKEKALPKDIKEFLDNADTGVALISFGTNPFTVDLENHMVDKVKALSNQTKLKFIWKCFNSSLVSTENIRCWNWLPQADVLRHKNIKMLIFQGGYQTLVEALINGKPMLVSPLTGDQFMNANKIEKLCVGKQFSIYEDTVNTFFQLAKDVLNDVKYAENAAKIGQQIIAHQETPIARAIWWVDYVIRHGNTKHLRAGYTFLIPTIVIIEMILYFSILFTVVFLVMRRKCATHFSLRNHVKNE